MKIALALLVAVTAFNVWVDVAKPATTPPSTVAKQAFTDYVKPFAQLKATLLSVRCGGEVEPTVHVCAFRIIFKGKHKCRNAFVAYRPGYHTTAYYQVWKCNSKAPPLPPVPPIEAFNPLITKAKLPGA